MLLDEHPLSSYAQKITIALREKGVPLTAELPERFGTGRDAGPSRPPIPAPRCRCSSTGT